MGKFIAGAVIGALGVLVAGFCYLHFGFIDPRADAPVGSIEQAIAMPALDAAVDKRAPEVRDPLPPA